ncbi:MAG: GWxTD domain-containing protein [Acidobacteria bacterium]|jgi:GWxTD domain-containing protein|nr:GWxTD domain-containing protein [Acidobacteriota bacterium]
MAHRGSNRRCRFCCAALLFFATLGAAGLAWAAKGGTEDATRDWDEGPVRYLMTRSEARLFRSQETAPERIAFIRNFWERRDPDPRTPQNEARLGFWQRVAEANGQFTGSGKPGWKTDRGKIYILLGPPDDIERDENYDTGAHAGARGMMRWIYYGLASASNRVVTVIPFIRTADEDWLLSDSARFASPSFTMLQPADQALPGAVDRLIDQVPWANGNLGTAMDLARLQEIPSERELLEAIVKSEQFLGSYEASGALHLLSGPGGETLLAITVALPRARLVPAWDGSAVGLAQRFAVAAELRPRGAPGAVPLTIPEDAFVPEPAPAAGDPWLRFQAVRPVPPGAWQLSAVIYDRSGGGAGSTAIDLTIPDFAPRGAPRLYGPLLGTDEPAAGAEAGGDATFPFRAGPLRVLPTPRERVAAEAPARFFARVEPPPGGDGPVTLAWRVLGAGGEPTGLDGASDDARGPWRLEIPAGRLAPGSYRLVVTASAAGGAPLERETAFEVSAASAGPGAP